MNFSTGFYDVKKLFIKYRENLITFHEYGRRNVTSFAR